MRLRIGFLALVLVGCDSDVESLSDRPEATNKKLDKGRMGRAEVLHNRDGRRKSSIAGIDLQLEELSQTEDPLSRRDLLTRIMLELPAEEHEIAVEAVIEDLNRATPANLLEEYLETSSLMSPALQLPGIVRLLEENSLSSLQRSVMEHQLRQDLNLSAEQSVSSWRSLVEKHLKQNRELISE